MGLCVQIVRDPSGIWSVHGLPGRAVASLASLTASIDYARKESGAAPATIVLMVEGFYAVIHQELGWPRRFVAGEWDGTVAATETNVAGNAGATEETAVAGLPIRTRLRGWLKRWSRSIERALAADRSR